jgi:hypothetical protein
MLNSPDSGGGLTALFLSILSYSKSACPSATIRVEEWKGFGNPLEAPNAMEASPRVRSLRFFIVDVEAGGSSYDLSCLSLLKEST